MSIEEYKQSVKPGSRKDSLGHLIAARDQDSGAGLSDEELAANAAIFLFAGISFHFICNDDQGVDTTSTALTYITYALANRARTL
jgi:cytochrome P450